MRTGILEKERLEVGGTGGQHHLVALDRSAVDGQRHVREGLRLQQLLEHGQQVAPVIVPAQTVLLRLHLVSIVDVTGTSAAASAVEADAGVDHGVEAPHGPVHGIFPRLANGSHHGRHVLDPLDFLVAAALADGGSALLTLPS